MRAAVHAGRGEYKLAEEALDKTIQQMPREAGHYINRALRVIISVIYVGR